MRLFQLISFLLCFLTSTAQAATLVLVLGEGKPHREFQEVLSEALRDSSWRILAITQEPSGAQTASPDLIVTIGSDALRKTLQNNPSQPILAALLTRQSYDRALNDFVTTPRRISAVFLDQPPSRQALFIRHLLPDAKRVGMLVGTDTRTQAPRFQQAMNQRGLRLEQEEVENESVMLPTLNGLISRVDLLLAIPDTNLYNRATLKSVLITTLRSQKPVIGFSESMVNAGALAAIHTTPTQAAKQTAQLIQNLGSALPAPQNANTFTLSINQSVAQSLGIKLSDEAMLLKVLSTEGETR